VVKLEFRIVTGFRRGSEMVTCAAVKVMVCYRLGDKDGNGNVC